MTEKVEVEKEFQFSIVGTDPAGLDDASGSETTSEQAPATTASATNTPQTNGSIEPNRSPPSTRRRKKQYAVSTQWERQVAEGREPRDCNTYMCCFARRIGHMYALISYPDGTPIFIAGPCWPFCVFVTVPLIIGLSGLVSYFLVIDDSFHLPDWILYLYYPTVALVLVALCCVSCRDPGLMERVTDEEAGRGGWFWNEQVGSFRPPGALYCRECGVLIQDYDHLCPWTGTGIGRRNMLAFKAFVVSVNVLCYFSVGILIWALLDGIAT